MAPYSFPQELQQSFETDIVSGALARGQWFSFGDLQTRYHADPMDLSRVLFAAFRKGLIEKDSAGAVGILGKSQPAIQSVFQHATKAGLSPKSVVRAVEVVPASAQVAQKLGLAEQDSVYRQIRTRLVNDEIVANQNNYIPIEVCPGLETVDLTHTSFQETLEGRFHAVVADVEEHFEIRLASEQDIHILDLEAGANILVVQRLSLSSNQLPLVWADIHVRTDRYHYVKDLWPEAAALLHRK
jgi:DNA-binding GntR family transcriptional regulator